MPEVLSSRLVFKVEFVSAAPIEGTDEMLVTLRTDAAAPLEVRLTRPEAADLVALIALDRARTAERDACSGDERRPLAWGSWLNDG